MLSDYQGFRKAIKSIIVTLSYTTEPCVAEGNLFIYSFNDPENSLNSISVDFYRLLR